MTPVKFVAQALQVALFIFVWKMWGFAADVCLLAATLLGGLIVIEEELHSR